MFATIFIGNDSPYSVDLEQYGKDTLTFGREPDNDIVIDSKYVSRHHGAFIRDGLNWRIQDNNSTNGIVINSNRISEQLLSNGMKISIGPKEHKGKIILVFSNSNQDGNYKYFSFGNRNSVTIGRLPESDIYLGHVGASRLHAEILVRGDGAYLRVHGKNGVNLNGTQFFTGEQKLEEMDRFQIMDTQFLYRTGELVYFRYKDGFGLTANHVSKLVNRGKKQKKIVNDVSFQIEPGELVAIIGGSGAGKSSLMKCISYYTKFTQGSVLIQGEDISTSYDSLKRLIGYVPQTDIVYDNLTLERMLYYSAGLRMSPDSTKEEIGRRIAEVINMVELRGHENTLIGKLSGGQKKRASIAVELLSDPGIFFLDEPTSGLDPGTERNLMHTLKNMAGKGKTIILVTHTPLNLHLCDKIIFMGYGGNLCYCGSPDNALQFFGVDNFVDIYNLIQQNPAEWKRRYEAQTTPAINIQRLGGNSGNKYKVSGMRQTFIMMRRYAEMIWNDKKKLLLQLLMAPGLGLILYIAFSSSLHPFEVSKDTQTFGLALSCCCFWIGLFQSIQEVCKERIIMEREKMADLKPGAYLMSKLAVLGIVLLFQCLLLLGTVWLIVGHPDNGVLIEKLPFLEYLITTYLTAFSAMTMGLCVSGFVGNTDQAVSVAPLLLIPQILFSEIICSLSGIAEKISWLVSCKWSCLAYGASAMINDLPGEYGDSESALWQSGSDVDGFIHARYDFDTPYWALHNPTPKSWILLICISIVLIIFSYVAIKKRREL